MTKQLRQRRRIACCGVAAALMGGALPLLTHGLASAPISRSSRRTSSRRLVAELQSCVTPEQVLETVVPQLTRKMDPDGGLASLVLIRLSKLFIGRDNSKQNEQDDACVESLWQIDDDQQKQLRLLQLVASCLAESDLSNPEALVEGTKAYSLLLRLLSGKRGDGLVLSVHDDEPLIRLWEEHGNGVQLAPHLESHQLSGLKWAFDSFSLVDKEASWHESLQQSFDQLSLPFSIIPGCLRDISDLSVATLSDQVEFRVDDIRTVSNKVVQERRQTAWQGDPAVAPFVYSGKSMPRRKWSPVVKTVRDRLFQQTNEYYDCCLLNLYPNGQSGMRYHIDPDQGSLWDYDTAVVSVGATRRFAFRPIQAAEDGRQHPHSFLVLHGDVTHMFGDCQQRFQHTVKKADNRFDESPRSSLVFKRTWKPC